MHSIQPFQNPKKKKEKKSRLWLTILSLLPHPQFLKSESGYGAPINYLGLAQTKMG